MQNYLWRKIFPQTRARIGVFHVVFEKFHRYAAFHRFFKKPSMISAALHAASSAYLADIRLVGLLMPIFTFVFIAGDFILIPEKRKEWKRQLAVLGAYAALFLFFLVLFWPLLWEDPAANFWNTLRGMGQFSRWSGTTLYLGEYVKAAEVPWHYIPVWIAVTTPLAYSLLCITGFSVTAWRFLVLPGREAYRMHRGTIFFSLWFFAPLLAAWLLKPELYDGWRHFYFMYPAFLMIALIGLVAVWDFASRHLAPWPKKAFLSAVAVLLSWSLGSAAYFMVRYHPYQNLYFNALAGSMGRAKADFEMDYWGLTYKEGLEYILRTDGGDRIPVFFAYGSPAAAVYGIESKDATRLILTEEPEDAKYILSNYRWHKEEYPPGLDEVYNVSIRGTKAMSVFKMY